VVASECQLIVLLGETVYAAEAGDSPKNPPVLAPEGCQLFSEGLRAAAKHEEPRFAGEIMLNGVPWKEGWNGHKWVEPNGRHLDVAPDDSAVQYHCARCAREFLVLESSGRRLAVYASVISFYQLTDDVTERWLQQRCPGERLARDDEDRGRRIREIPVSPGLSVSGQMHTMSKRGRLTDPAQRRDP
jgi:hypothetical protein